MALATLKRAVSQPRERFPTEWAPYYEGQRIEVTAQFVEDRCPEDCMPVPFEAAGAE